MSDPTRPEDLGPGGEPEPGLPPSAAVPLEPPGIPLPSRLAGVLFSPSATFRHVVARPRWVGAFAIYIAVIALTAFVYSLKTDWEGLMRAQMEDSLAFRMALAVMPEEQADAFENTVVREVTAIGSGGMVLRTTIQTVIASTVAFHLMAVLFATLLYLMGSLAELKLGRVYLDGLICIGVLVAFLILGSVLRIPFAEDSRAGLPYEAGLNALLVVVYFWLLYRAVERQAAFRRLISVYAHAMIVPTVAALLTIVVILLRTEPLTITIDQVLLTNLGALTGTKGTTAAATLLSAIDLFRLWELVAVSIGFAALTGMSIGTSAAIAFLPWGFITMVRLAIAAVFGG